MYTCHRTVTSSATRLLQYLYWHSMSTDTGPPMLQHPSCGRTFAVASPSLSPHLQCHRSSTGTATELSQDLPCRRSSSATEPALAQDLHCHRTSNVQQLQFAGYLLARCGQCHRTSTVVAPHQPQGTSLSQDLNCC